MKRLNPVILVSAVVTQKMLSIHTFSFSVLLLATAVYPLRAETPLISMVDVLANVRTVSELDLLPEQYAEVRQILQDLRQEVRDAIEAGKVLAPEDRSVAVRAAIAEASRDATERTRGVLLDHQWQKLQRLTVRARFDRYGIETALKSDDVMPTLAALKLNDTTLDDIKQGVNDAQEEFERKNRELTREYNEELAKIRAEYVSEVLGILPEEARKIMSEIIIEPPKR